MEKKKVKKQAINIFLLLAFFCFLVFISRLSYLALATDIDGINMKEFAASRSIYSSTISAKRGSIYDKYGNYLAQNVASYTLIAYLDPARSEGEDKLYHVKDKKATAKALATVIDMKEEDILAILEQEDLYQVEFGTAGSGLTELEKEAIEALELPGIDFIEDEKRYYPNGDFLSYTLGYARKDEEGNITGEMGVESLLDEVLSGTNGYLSYQMDLNGYKIAGTKEERVDAINGNDVYLTIDSNIQFFVEQALKTAYEKYNSEWLMMIVADAKTGAILASSQQPSFDPNVLDITNWNNLAVSEPYEPGSIMKIYTYMAALEAGTYEGDATFASGKYVTDDGTVIYDWDRNGFGKITYDQGFLTSSNVGVINMLNIFIDKNTLHDYFLKMGFGEKTGITLANEERGKISFNYQTEVYNAGFGQGITTTPMQHIQALTAIANDGVMLTPYIVDKVVNDEGEVVFEGKRTEKAVVASKETTDKIRDLMYDTVHSDWYAATGSNYRISGYDVIGKTGTAQLVNPNTGKYYTSDYYTIKSFVGMWPKDDPELIVYVSTKKPTNGSSKSLYTSFKEVAENVSNYLNIFGEKEDEDIANFEVANYLNKDKEEIVKLLDKNKISSVVIGDGTKVIAQYPSEGALLSRNDTVFLLTDSTSYKMPNFVGYSKKEVMEVCSLLDMKCTFDGYGYATKQSIKAGTVIRKDDEQVIEFKERY